MGATGGGRPLSPASGAAAISSPLSAEAIAALSLFRGLDPWLPLSLTKGN
jgi:hypothetical protein